MTEPTSESVFGAAGPALGYLAQVDYALLAALERMDDEDDFAVSVETLDDIVFHDVETDDATEKWQNNQRDAFADGREYRSLEDLGELGRRAERRDDTVGAARRRRRRADGSAASHRP
jgi:hypothetical protein